MRRLRHALSPRSRTPLAAILVYHRIARVESDPFRIAVSPETFGAHLAAVSERYRVVPLDAVVDMVPDGAGGAPVVAVTFDDGYADTLSAACPIAAAHDVPVTVFVTVGPVLTGEPFWWDEIAAALLGGSRGRDRLTLEVAGRRRELPLSSPGQRVRACREVHRLLRPLAPDERRAAVGAVTSGGAGRPDGRPLTLAELRELDSLPGVTVGAHTIDHPSLPQLEPAAQLAEVEGSGRQLAALLGHPVELFAYPYGRGDDLRRRTVQVAADAGYRAACTTVQAAVTARSSVHALPRLTVYDEPADRLVSRLQRLVGAAAGAGRTQDSRNVAGGADVSDRRAVAP